MKNIFCNPIPMITTTTITLAVDLGGEAAGAVNDAADVLEAAQARLDRLAEAAGPDAVCADADFDFYRQRIDAALLALRSITDDV